MLLMRTEVLQHVNLISPQAGSTELRISEYPPVTLALRSDKAVVLDTMTDIYIWIGSKVQVNTHDC